MLAGRRAAYRRRLIIRVGRFLICARCQRVTQTLELAAFVEKAARAKALGLAPVGLGRKVSEDVDCHLRRGLLQRLQDVEAVAATKRDVDDDPITEEEMAEIMRGAEQVERGEYVTLDDLEQDIER